MLEVEYIEKPDLTIVPKAIICDECGKQNAIYNKEYPILGTDFVEFCIITEDDEYIIHLCQNCLEKNLQKWGKVV